MSSILDLRSSKVLQSLYWNSRNKLRRPLWRKLLSYLRYNAGIVIYPKVNINCNINSNLYIKSKLTLGKVHELGTYKVSDLICFENSELLVGSFTFYTGFQLVINKNAKVSIGSGYANYNVKIDCFEEINIGNNVAISHNVIIRDSDSHKISGQSERPKRIVIGDNVWIGMNSIILKGVNLGNGAVVGAGSVITKDVPERCLVAGVPAKIIRENVEWR